ncbi:hypothetical protein EAG_05048 [Camponotus floridanus]|uniref:Uncharacterized protein n=1 Tax=Camponotus floridanus TaxID=104421 RepID=E2A998_CAMFO|nr:hypothetical protein EAG_05048 [Camponotus floridanus]
MHRDASLHLLDLSDELVLRFDLRPEIVEDGKTSLNGTEGDIGDPHLPEIVHGARHSPVDVVLSLQQCL